MSDFNETYAQQQASFEEEAFRFWNDCNYWFPSYWTLFALSVHIFLYVVR